MSLKKPQLDLSKWADSDVTPTILLSPIAQLSADFQGRGPRVIHVGFFFLIIIIIIIVLSQACACQEQGLMAAADGVQPVRPPWGYSRSFETEQSKTPSGLIVFNLLYWFQPGLLKKKKKKHNIIAFQSRSLEKHHVNQSSWPLRLRAPAIPGSWLAAGPPSGASDWPRRRNLVETHWQTDMERGRAGAWWDELDVFSTTERCEAKLTHAACVCAGASKPVQDVNDCLSQCFWSLWGPAEYLLLEQQTPPPSEVT